MSITIRLLENIKDIQSNINGGIATFINDKLSSNTNTILRSSKEHIKQSILLSPEINSLSSSDPLSLAGQFGFNNNPSSIISAIVNSIVDSTQVKFVPYDNRLRGGGFNISCQPSNFLNLLTIPEGHTVYIGGDLHWLDWMLTKGDTIIVSNYRYNPQTGLGRSGFGNMVKGGAFRVPPQYSGDLTNNFVTRALSNPELDDKLTSLIRDILR